MIGAPVRLLEAADLPAAVELSASAGWNQTAGDWQMLLELAPEGCFCIEQEGRLAATATVLPYGNRIAWVGMVLTQPEFRRQGLARRLVTHAVHHARSLGIQTVKLDASEEGLPLYESLGFRTEQPVERWMLEGKRIEHSQDRHPQPSSCTAELDAAAYGYDRMTLLRSLSERSQILLAGSSHLFSRPGRLCRYIGPFLAEDAETAAQLITQCIHGLSATDWFWDLLPQNQNALDLARSLGFVRQRVLTRMTLGPDIRGKQEWIYGIAGFELG